MVRELAYVPIAWHLCISVYCGENTKGLVKKKKKRVGVPLRNLTPRWPWNEALSSQYCGDTYLCHRNRPVYAAAWQEPQNAMHFLGLGRIDR